MLSIVLCKRRALLSYITNIFWSLDLSISIICFPFLCKRKLGQRKKECKLLKTQK